MGFLSTETLKSKLKTLIVPSRLDRLKRGAYELALGPEAYITSDKLKKAIAEEGQLEIPPGQFALLLTEEVVNIPNNMIALISIKAGIKFRGLINVSGFHVDPGFKGRLKFSVYNAGSNSIVLSRKTPAFLIWFCPLDRPTKDLYNGDKSGQMTISDEDVMKLRGEIASPASLDTRLKNVEGQLAAAQKVFWSVLVVWFLAAFRQDLKEWIFPHPHTFESIAQPAEPARATDTHSGPLAVSKTVKKKP